MAHDEGRNEESAESSTKEASGWQRFRSGVIEVVIIIVGALLISAGLRAFVGQLFVIPSGSMENTLEPHDRVAVLKLSDYHRGDIVVFKDTEHWLTERGTQRSAPGKVLEFVGLLPNTSSNYLIKRVIGMPGDTVSCCTAEGRVTVNGKALDESSYLYSEGGQTVAPSEMRFSVTVPKDRIFVMGDHRNASGDSRVHIQDSDPDEYTGAPAFIREEDVVGPARAIVVPFNRIRGFSPPDDFQGIEDRSAKAPTRARICVGGSCAPA